MATNNIDGWTVRCTNLPDRIHINASRGQDFVRITLMEDHEVVSVYKALRRYILDDQIVVRGDT